MSKPTISPIERQKRRQARIAQRKARREELAKTAPVAGSVYDYEAASGLSEPTIRRRIAAGRIKVIRSDRRNGSRLVIPAREFARCEGSDGDGAV